MATSAPIITVPKPSRSAYNPNRPLRSNALVAAQVQHFAEADKNLPPEFQTGVDPASITTEGEAAAYVRKVTEAIHRSGGIPKVKDAG
jgi:hypothetical protein